MAIILSNSTRTFLLCSFLFLLLSLRVQAQQEVQEEMETERPDEAESSSVIPRGTFQLEAGYFYQQDEENGLTEKIQAYPTALLRIGLLERLELRVRGALKDSVMESVRRRSVSGFGPLGIGAKVQLWEESGARPEAALIAMVALPVGKRALQPNRPQPELRLTLSNEFTEDLQLTYNLNYAWVDKTNMAGYAVNLSNSFTDRITAYLEFFGNKAAGERAEHQADVGLMFLVLPNLQLDFAAGRRLNSVSPDFFLNTGFSVRLPR